MIGLNAGPWEGGQHGPLMRQVKRTRPTTLAMLDQIERLTPSYCVGF